MDPVEDLAKLTNQMMTIGNFLLTESLDDQRLELAAKADSAIVLLVVYKEQLRRLREIPFTEEDLDMICQNLESAFDILAGVMIQRTRDQLNHTRERSK